MNENRSNGIKSLRKRKDSEWVPEKMKKKRRVRKSGGVMVAMAVCDGRKRSRRFSERLRE